MVAVYSLRVLASVASGLLLVGVPAGCAKLRPTTLASSTLRSGAPRQLVIVCRPNVLEMQDGSRSPGVVAQAFLMGGDAMGPVTAPPGRFHFTAGPPSPPGGPILQPTEAWTFDAAETPRHLIQQSLGPCYAFWLPCKPSGGPHRPLLIQGRFESEGARLEASPVKLLVPAG